MSIALRTMVKLLKTICHLLLPGLVLVSDHLFMHGNVNLHITGDPRALFPPYCMCQPPRNSSSGHVIEQVQRTGQSNSERRPVTHSDFSPNTTMEKAAAWFSKKHTEKNDKFQWTFPLRSSTSWQSETVNKDHVCSLFL